MTRHVAMAMGAHPDDIEFMMAGTLLLLGRAGWKLHTMNLANGSCGTVELPREEIVRIRTAEAEQAAAKLGAVFHEPLVDDIEIVYDVDLLRRVTAVVREVQPAILLVPSPQDYMEDHANTSRLAVSAAFVRGMRNFTSAPEVPAASPDIAVYHALPYGLRDGLRRRVRAELYVDVSAVLEEKAAALALHKSQKEWLDKSQGLDAYLTTMREMTAEVGRMAGWLAAAEGWRRHLPLGLGPEAFDPLSETLGNEVHADAAYRASLEAGGAPLD